MKAAMFATALLLVAAAPARAFEVTELTGSTFDEAIAGKGAFVKFFAPWCGHCKSMAPAWKQLAEEYAESKTALIAEVDCTKDENKGVCSQYGVKGFPTIKYFVATSGPDGDKYEGGRDYDSLSKFAKDNLGPSCSTNNLDLCSESDKAAILEYAALSESDRAAAIAEVEKTIADANKAQEELLKSLQSQFEAGKKKTEEAIAAVTPKLKLLRAVLPAEGAKDEL